MREILFRGKRVDNGEWVTGVLNVLTKKVAQIGGYTDYGTHVRIGNSYGIDPATVEQYTGIKDKNGKRIFEGDITAARIVDGGHTGFEWPPAKTVFENGAFCRKEQRESVPFRSYSARVEFEVVGNIYDNNELLEDST